MTDPKSRAALKFHSEGRPGKIEVIPTKPHNTQRDLSLAYSPGVAVPCLEIANNPEDVYKYTTKGNLVAVITNGTAVLGLGDIGASASKPVMEGKGLLFKIYADIDVFDIEVDANEVDAFCTTVKAIAPTFGGINLEDIKAPECFEIEKRLVEELDIPVMHDDQHGTAIITSAALINALFLAEKKIEEVKIVFNGAGAAALSCANLCLGLGVPKEHITLCDSKGVIHTGREDLNRYKTPFARDTEDRDLNDAISGADVFIGLSKANILSPDMLNSMAKTPIVFALANPEPEIDYALALSTRKDVIMATGRSDNPNQVNNVLGFPFIFRGALDVRAKRINEEMKLAAVKAIAELARERVPEEVLIAYGEHNLQFSEEYIIPKPNDPRLISRVAPAVAKAAIDTGVARIQIDNWEEYATQLNNRMGRGDKLMDNIARVAKRHPQKLVFAEADNENVLKAAQIAYEEGIAFPILLGREQKIREMMEEIGFEKANDIVIVDPKSTDNKPLVSQYAQVLWSKRQRRGYTLEMAKKKLRERNYFGAAMVEVGDAQAMISGVTRSYPETLRPALDIIGLEDGIDRICGLYIMNTKRGPLFFADTTVNVNPTAEQLAQITILVAESVKRMGIQPNIAMLSYSNFGSTMDPESEKVRKALQIVHSQRPDIVVDGELQANFALNTKTLERSFPFSSLVDKEVNTLVFPNLAAGNISYKLLQSLGEIEAIGPIILGLKKSVHVLAMESTVQNITSMAALAVADAHSKSKRI